MTLQEQLANIVIEAEESVVEASEDSRRHTVATITAYLVGVPMEHLVLRTDLFEQETLKKLKKEKEAGIIRNLCMIRTAFFRHNTSIYNQLVREKKSLYTISEVPYKSLTELEADGIKLTKNKANYAKNNYVKDINLLIKDRINNCKRLYAEWVNWEYIKSIFIMPGGNTDDGIKAVGDFYTANRSVFPYECYINGPTESKGNILANDQTFMMALFEWNGDIFYDRSKVRDLDEEAKNNIRRFFKRAVKIDIMVDCENSNPYRLCSALKTLEEEAQNKIQKIILINDPHASTAWSIVHQYTSIPVEEILIERLYEHKSLADIKLTATTCKEYYTEDIDSFVLLSSDSDFWGLISSLPQADFIIMMEKEKCGMTIREKLTKEKYYYCFLNDFYSGEENEIMNLAVRKNFIHELNKAFEAINVEEIFTEAEKNARTQLGEDQKTNLFRKLKEKLVFGIEDNKVKFTYK